MELENKEIKLNFEYLNQVLSFCGSSLTGKVMKRFEIIDDKSILKSECRELIYEEMRKIREILVGYAYGQELTIFKFTKPKPKQ